VRRHGKGLPLHGATGKVCRCTAPGVILDQLPARRTLCTRARFRARKGSDWHIIVVEDGGL
jgi:hypothetical protein